MGRHHRAALAGEESVQAFADFVMAEQEVLSLLQKAIEKDQGMLIEMRRGPTTS